MGGGGLGGGGGGDAGGEGGEGGGGEGGGGGGSGGGEGGEGDEGGGGKGGGGGGGIALVTVGGVRTVMPRTAEAVVVVVPWYMVVPRVEAREDWTAMAVVEAGTEMVAVMRTLAAATAMVTSDASTPAAVAKFAWRLAVTLGV